MTMIRQSVVVVVCCLYIHLDFSYIYYLFFCYHNYGE